MQSSLSSVYIQFTKTEEGKGNELLPTLFGTHDIHTRIKVIRSTTPTNRLGRTVNEHQTIYFQGAQPANSRSQSLSYLSNHILVHRVQ
jgi:hypothetical protein